MMSIGLIFKGPVRLYLLLTAIITFACYAFVQLCIYLGGNEISVYTLMSLIVGVMLYLGPLTFAKRDATMMTLLPAKAVEKWLFYMLFSLVAVPAVVQGVWYGSDYIYAHLTSGEPLNEMILSRYNLKEAMLGLDNRFFIVCISIVQTSALIISVLYTVLRSTRHRVIKGLLTLAAVLFATGLLSALAGFVVAINELADKPDVTPDQAVNLINNMYPIFGFVYGLLAVYSIVMGWLCYRQSAKGEVKA